MPFPLPRANRVAACLLAPLCLAAGLALGATHARAQSTSQTDLPLFNKEKGHTIIANRVDIEVAGGPAARVTFDTGSTGLRILERYAGPNLRKTDRPLRETYGDGTQLEGYLGYAEIAFRTRGDGALRTTAEVPVHVVTQVSCRQDKPHCPGLEEGSAGVMGVRFDLKSEVMLSPLRFLPGAQGEGFIVDVKRDDPHVHIGLDAQSTRGFRFASLKPASPATTKDGKLPLWIADSIKTCFSIEGSQPTCGPLIYDTGGSAMDVPLEGLPPELLKGDFLRAGAEVGMEVPDTFRLAFRSEGHDDVRIRPGHGGNSGERFFRHYLVAFDGKNGRIGFLPRPAEEVEAWYRH